MHNIQLKQVHTKLLTLSPPMIRLFSLDLGMYGLTASEVASDDVHGMNILAFTTWFVVTSDTNRWEIRNALLFIAKDFMMALVIDVGFFELQKSELQATLQATTSQNMPIVDSTKHSCGITRSRGTCCHS